MSSLKPLALAAVVCGVALVPGADAQKKEYMQLQRDMALLQDALRQMEQKSSERMAALEALLKQSTEKQDKLTTGQAVLERAVSGLDDGLTEPQRATAAKVDSLLEQFSGLRAMVEEMGVSVERLQLDVRDIKTHLTTLPPPMEGEEGAEISQSGVSVSDATIEAGISDYNRGNLTSARDLFQDYLTLYSGHARASEAQYWLAETYYSAADYEEAARQFAIVYKQYPLSTQAADALYKQGLALARFRRRDEAIEVFESVIQRFPETSMANLARAELATLLNSKPSPGR